MGKNVLKFHRGKNLQFIEYKLHFFKLHFVKKKLLPTSWKFEVSLLKKILEMKMNEKYVITALGCKFSPLQY